MASATWLAWMTQDPAPMNVTVVPETVQIPAVPVAEIAPVDDEVYVRV